MFVFRPENVRVSIVHEFFEREIAAIPKQRYHETTVSLDVQTSPPLTK